MDLTVACRGTFVTMNYLPEHLSRRGDPLSELIMDYFDKLKSKHEGLCASLDYDFAGELQALAVEARHPARQVSIDALSLIVHAADKAHDAGGSLKS